MRKLLVVGLLLAMQVTFSQEELYRKSPESIGDALKSDCCFMGQNIISGGVGFSYGKISYLREGENIDFNRFTANLNLIVKLYKDLQIRTSFFTDLNGGADKPKWLSNMFYSIGYYNWRNNTFSYGYENYQPNKFDGSYSFLNNMKRGFFFTSFNHQFLNKESSLKLDETSQIIVSPFVRYSFEYTDRTGLEVLGNNKFVLGTSMRYTIWEKIYVEGAVYFYPDKKSKMPWDPDFTYGFGMFDWRSFKLNISYGNWIANRFPWNDKEMKNDFTNGEFKVEFTYTW